MKFEHRVYPFAPRQWMPPVPGISRLKYALTQSDIHIDLTDLAALHETLLREVEAGTAEAAQNTVESLQQELKRHGKEPSRRKLEQMVADYLGNLPWETRLRQMQEEPVPVSIPAYPPISWWRDKVTTCARFAYRVDGKLEGLLLDPEWNEWGSANITRVRILTLGTSASNFVSSWKKQYLEAQGDHLAHIAYAREAAYRYRPEETSSATRVPRRLTHFIIVEADISRAIDCLEGEPLMQQKLRSLHVEGLCSRQLMKCGRTPVHLTPVCEEVLLGFLDSAQSPGVDLQPWPLESGGWNRILEGSADFTAIVDLSLTQGDVDKATSRRKVVVVCERFGLLPLPGKSRARKLRRLFHRHSAIPNSVDWQSIVRASPFHEAVNSSTKGLLLTRSSGEVVRYAPWATGASPHFCLDVSSKGNALTFELAAQAHADGKRVLVYGDHEQWSMLMEKLTPGEVLKLNENAPCSLNPFSDVETEAELESLLPAFLNITYDLLGLTHNLASAALTRHFVSAWKIHGSNLELKHVANHFRPFGKHDERALQAAIDHYVDVAGPWVSGRSAGSLRPGILCIDAYRLTTSYEVRYVLGPVIGQLVAALAYRNAVAAQHSRQEGSLTLISASHLAGSRNRAEILAGHFAGVDGSIGLDGNEVLGYEHGLLQSFRHRRLDIPRIRVGLAQDSDRLYRECLLEEAVKALPPTTDDSPSRVSFAVLRWEEALGYFTLECPMGVA